MAILTIISTSLPENTHLKKILVDDFEILISIRLVLALLQINPCTDTDTSERSKQQRFLGCFDFFIDSIELKFID